MTWSLGSIAWMHSRSRPTCERRGFRPASVHCKHGRSQSIGSPSAAECLVEAAATLPMLACTRSWTAGATTAGGVTGKMPWTGGAVLLDVNALDLSEGARHATPAGTVNCLRSSRHTAVRGVSNQQEVVRNATPRPNPAASIEELADGRGGGWELADTTAEMYRCISSRTG